MNSQRNEQLEIEILDKVWNKIEEDRSAQWPGVTNLIYCLTKAYWERTIGRPKPNRKTILNFVTGLVFEKALISFWQGDEGLSGEYEGIFYHIDGNYMELAIEDLDVMEFKSTRQATHKGTVKADDKRLVTVDDYSKFWLQQVAAYAYVKKRYTAKLAVLHIIPPELLAWDIEFTEADLISNWMMLQSRRTDLIHAVDTGNPPKPFTTNQEWECNNCVWLVLCNARKDG